jgi:RNA polymerase sigma-70 factor (ECF subfamily)
MTRINQEQFLTVLEEHKGILYKIANAYTNNTEDQKDLVQEMSIQVFRSFNKYDDRFKWSTFIYRIALNVAISFYRKQKIISRTDSITNSILELPDPESMVNDTHEELVLLQRFIEKLKPLDKALMLLYLDETSTSQMSEILGITETNVTSKIHRVKKKLREQFDNY